MLQSTGEEGEATPQRNRTKESSHRIINSNKWMLLSLLGWLCRVVFAVAVKWRICQRMQLHHRERFILNTVMHSGMNQWIIDSGENDDATDRNSPYKKKKRDRWLSIFTINSPLILYGHIEVELAINWGLIRGRDTKQGIKLILWLCSRKHLIRINNYQHWQPTIARSQCRCVNVHFVVLSSI